MKNKILFFLLNGVGGAERMTITISKFFNKDLFDVHYVVVCEGDDKILNFLPKRASVSFIRVKNPYCNLTYKLYKKIKKERPNSVFCASPAINTRLIIAAKVYGKTRVVVRSSNMYSFERKDVQLLMRLTYPWADKIILQQDEMRDELHKNINVPRDKTITLQNPLDSWSIEEGIKAPSPYNEDNNIKFLSVGRVSHEKGQDILIKAFSIVHRNIPTTSLYIVGKYDEKSSFFRYLSDLIQSQGVSDSVHMVGMDFNPYKWMKHCDCFVLPSRCEGLPNVLLEAMSLGKPSVSTLCLPIIKRLIEEGQNGYYCPIEDDVKLATAMMNAIKLKDCKLNYKPASPEDFINQLIITR